MIHVEGLRLHYAGAAGPTLENVDLEVAPGELVLITGPTGCGKSSLLNCLNGILQHESSARVEGTVLLDGRDVGRLELAQICRIAGTVFQNPDSQICTATPETEIAFGLENLAVDRATMIRRIEEALSIVRLEECRHQPATSLSGGQKQRLAIACALALKPKVLLLDEPLSQLDPGGVQEILSVIHDLKLAHELAVVLVEHRIEETIALADRVVLMHQGRIELDLTREEALADLAPMRRLGLNLPLLADLFERLGRPERPLRAENAPLLAVSGGAAGSGRRAVGSGQQAVPDPHPSSFILHPSSFLCEIRQLAFGYARHGPPVFAGLSVALRRGDRVALMGRNGSGKSTLLHLMAGLLTPRAGRIVWTGPHAPSVGLVMQVPDLMLFSESVRQEVAFAPIHARMARQQRERIVEAVLARMGLEDLADQAPFALSRGQRLRTAVASILSKQPSVLLLDEPTTGQDREQIERMMTGLEEDFELLVFCTHDVQTAARHADRIILLEAGRIVADGGPVEGLFNEKALESASIRQTSLQKYAMRHDLKALDVDSLMQGLGG